MKHLTKTKHGYALYIHVGDKDAAAVNSAIEAGAAAFGGNKSEFVRACVISGAQEPVAQKRIRLALEIAKESGPRIAGTVAGLLVKALTGCPTDTRTEFVGESQEFKELWGEDDSA